MVGRSSLECALRLVGAGAVCAFAVAAPAGDVIEPLATVRVASGLNLPIYVAHAPYDFSRLFIVEKPGRVKILDLISGAMFPQLFLDIDLIVGGSPEANSDPGLLGLAFHPDFQSNGRFYVHHISNQMSHHVRRFHVSAATPNVADAGIGDIIFTASQPFVNHNGGWIGFGPDGYLYIPLGDGGSQHDPDNRAQNLADLHGKILRIDVDGDDFPADSLRDYAIPPDNPFLGTPGAAPEIFAYGLRNPWQCSFDETTGALWIADVGQNAWEEIDVLPAGSKGGQNFGWRCYEGTHVHNTTGCAPPATMEFPIHEYGHVPSGGNSVTGGAVYRGCHIPTLRGAYLFADWVSDHIWALTGDGDGGIGALALDSELSPSLDGFPISEIASFGADALGELYIVEQGATGNFGEIFKVVPQFPGVSAADLDCNGMVNSGDLTILLGNWGVCPGCRADIDGSGVVGMVDLQLLLVNWG